MMRISRMVSPRRGSAGVDPGHIDRVEGYKRYRRWVDDGLELWKVRRRFTRRAGRGALRARCSLLTTQAELDGLSFPIFVHTFLELIHFGFNRDRQVVSL